MQVRLASEPYPCVCNLSRESVPIYRNARVSYEIVEARIVDARKYITFQAHIAEFSLELDLPINLIFFSIFS